MFTAWMAGVGCFTGLFLAALCVTCGPKDTGECNECSRTWRLGLAFSLGCLFLMLAALACIAWMGDLTPRSWVAKIGARGDSPRYASALAVARRPFGASQAPLLPARAALLTGFAHDQYASAHMAREHGISYLLNEPHVVGAISCRCGWRFVNPNVMARLPAADVLLDEYNAHRSRCKRAADAQEA